MSKSNRIRTSVIGLAVLFAASAFAAERFSDPTKPPAALLPSAQSQAKTKAVRPLELQAILHAAGRRVAIINGKRVHENENVDAATVVSISKRRVRLMREGKSIELSLLHKRIKKTESPKTRSPTRTDATEGIPK